MTILDVLEPKLVYMARMATQPHMAEVEKEYKADGSVLYQAIVDVPAPKGAKYKYQEYGVQETFLKTDTEHEILDKWRAAVVQLTDKVQSGDPQDTFI